MVDRIISLAEEGSILTEKVSDLLGLLNKAYMYGHSATRQDESPQTCMVAKMLLNIFLTPSLYAVKLISRATLVCSGEAVREAKGGCDRLKERYEEEESLFTLDDLEQMHTDAVETVATEKRALTKDRDQFSRDVDRIGEFSIIVMATLCVTHSCPNRQIAE